MKLPGKADNSVLPVHVGGAVGCAVLLLAGWWFGLGPLLSESQQESSLVQEADAAQDKASQSRATLAQLSAELERVQARLDEQPVSLEPVTRINAMLVELAGWADEHELTITKNNSGRPVALAYYDYVPISLAGEGRFTDVMGLFSRVHGERGDLGVVSFDLKRIGLDARVAFELELAWYVVSEAGGEATASAATD